MFISEPQVGQVVEWDKKRWSRLVASLAKLYGENPFVIRSVRSLEPIKGCWLLTVERGGSVLNNSGGESPLMLHSDYLKPK